MINAPVVLGYKASVFGYYQGGDQTTRVGETAL